MDACDKAHTDLQREKAECMKALKLAYTGPELEKEIHELNVRIKKAGRKANKQAKLSMPAKEKTETQKLIDSLGDFKDKQFEQVLIFESVSDAQRALMQWNNDRGKDMYTSKTGASGSNGFRSRHGGVAGCWIIQGESRIKPYGAGTLSQEITNEDKLPVASDATWATMGYTMGPRRLR